MKKRTIKRSGQIIGILIKPKSFATMGLPAMSPIEEISSQRMKAN